jgi:hypothetical protein
MNSPFLLIRVAHWDPAGERVLFYEGGVNQIPRENILWIDLEWTGGWSQRLIGADRYWVRGGTFGVTFEQSRLRFGGLASFAWEFNFNGSVGMGEVPPPQGARIAAGVELPDEQWEEVVRTYG